MHNIYTKLHIIITYIQFNKVFYILKAVDIIRAAVNIKHDVIPETGKTYSLLQNVHTASRAQSAYYSMVIGGSFHENRATGA